jgi:murein DD-endopeptidase MepM/ murein hydrolase activator NlpD
MANSLDSLSRKLEQILGLLERIDGYGSGGSGGPSGGVMNGSLAGFSNTEGGAGPNAASFGMTRASVAMRAVGIGVATFGGVAQGVSNAMPDVNMTLGRASGFYGAGVQTGFAVNRSVIERTTRLGLGQFQTSAGADAAVAGILTGQGLMPGSSQYARTVASVGQAARFMNMPNEVAAQAIGGLGMGASSANLLNTFGIFTSNQQGQEFSQGQIFEQIAGRLTAGRGQATVEETLKSLRSGGLGSAIRNSGMTQEQQYMLSQYMIARAQGVQMDLSDPGAMDTLMAMGESQGFENPFAAAMKVNSAESSLMEKATQPYIQGVNDAADALVEMKKAMEGLPDALYQMNAAVQTFVGNNTGSGLLSAAGALGGGLVAGGMLANMAGGRAAAQAATALGKSPAAAMARTAGGGVLKAAGGVGGAIGLTVSAADAYSKGQSGEAMNAMDFGGAALSGAALGATIGSFIPVPGGTIIGAGVGALAGMATAGISNFMGSQGGEGGGTDDTVAASTSVGGGANEAFYLTHPTKSGRMAARYGARYSYYHPQTMIWPNGHKGIDYQGSRGDAILAAAPGEASIENGGELGLRVKIKHSNGMYTFYCHLSATSISNGQRVERGHVVGRMGNTGGKSTGVHLHFALSKSQTTAGHIDPTPYLRGTGGSALDAPPSVSGQSAAGNTPAPSGESTTEAAQGGADTSAVVSVSSASGLSGSSGTSVVEAPGNAAAAGAAGSGEVQPWSSDSVTFGGQNAGEGGDGADLEMYAPALGSAKRGAVSKKVVTNNVTIEVKIERGTPEEARKFAQYVKEYLEQEDMINNMGSR